MEFSYSIMHVHGIINIIIKTLLIMFDIVLK